MCIICILATFCILWIISEEVFLRDGVGNHSGNGTLPKRHTMIKSEDKTKTLAFLIAKHTMNR